MARKRITKNEKVYLTCQDDKSNKFYEMVNNGDGTFTASWGKVGYEPQGSKEYDIELWSETLVKKVKKGYK